MNRVKKNRLSALVSILVIFCVHNAHATPIVVNPLDASGDGEFSNLGSSNQQIADDFILTEASILQSISWFGRYGSDSVTVDGPISFSLRIYEDDGNSPAVAPLATFDLMATAVASGLEFSGDGCSTESCTWFSYSADLLDFNLDTAGTYWISLVETDSRTVLAGDSQWLWADTDSTGLRSFRNSDASDWTTTSDINHAFTLNGTHSVPEPGTFMLLSFGLLGLGLARMRTT